MKFNSRFAVLAGLMVAVEAASAFNYKDQDLLLVFRRTGYQDMVFNAGSVGTYLGRPTGTRIPVTNWDLSAVTQNFDGSLEGVSFIVAASTSATDPVRRVWLGSSRFSGTPTDQSGSRWGQIRSKIDFVGVQAMTATGTNSSVLYVSSPSEASAYTYIASSGGTLDVTTMSGLAPFPVEGVIPAKLRFFEIKANNTTPKPAADEVGSFEMTVEGVLTFVSGVGGLEPIPQPQVTGINRSAGQTTLTFTTATGVSYRLRASSSLGPGAGSWTTLPTTVVGTGGTVSLTDASEDPVRFYSVEAFR